jgi:cell shape-determining protein MreC
LDFTGGGGDFSDLDALQSRTRTEITTAKKLLRESLNPPAEWIERAEKGLSSVSTGLENKEELARQLEQMKEQNDKLSWKTSSCGSLRQGAAIKDFAGLQASQSGTIRPGCCQGYWGQPNNWFKFITLDKGARDGISQGMR